MKLIRVKKDQNFTTINNEFIFNKNLSLKAKGLLCHILALPNDWTLYVEEVGNWHKDGKAAIYSAFKELTANGYMKREQIRDSKGKIIKWNYLVFEKPHTDFQDVDNQYVDKQDVDNRTLLNTNNTKDLIILNTNNSKTEGIEYPFELNVEAWESWKEFRKKEYRKSYKDLGEKAAIKKLLKLTQSKEEQALILEQSMENGWIGIFALKSEKKRKINDLMNEYNKGLEILNKQFDD
tara:strand:- start:979 stop:1686 length:708 start_codon:yes stop_codon:yes gene_type:complete